MNKAAKLLTLTVEQKIDAQAFGDHMEKELNQSYDLTGEDRENQVQIDIYDSIVGFIIVSKVFVPKSIRGQGIGQSIMERIIKFADGQSVPLALTPTTDFGGKITKLWKWYKELGFKENKGRNRNLKVRETMIRHPG